MRLILLLLPLLAACAQRPVVVRDAPGPIPVAIDPRCLEPCAALPPWQPGPDGTARWSDLGAIAIADAEIRDDCEARRQHCAVVLRRLIQAGVITAKAGQ